MDKYVGVDWLAAAVTLVSLYLLGSGRRWGFAFGMLASVAWVAVSWLAESHGMLAANSVFFFMHLRGWVRWRAQPPRDAAAVAAPSAPGTSPSS